MAHPIITAISLEGGALVAKKPITVRVTVHGGSTAGTYAIMLIVARLEDIVPAQADWKLQTYNETVPANVDTTFTLPTPWLWSGSVSDTVPYHFEARLSKPPSGPTLSQAAMEWHSIGFKQTLPK